MTRDLQTRHPDFLLIRFAGGGAAAVCEIDAQQRGLPPPSTEGDNLN
jgi:hypothetical protein